VPVRRALRTLTTFADVAVFLWRRYGSPPANGTTVALQPQGVVDVADEVVDDAAAAPPTQTVRFGLDGQHYEVALSDEEAAELRATVGRYIAAGRRAARQTRTPRIAPADPVIAQGMTPNGHDSAAIRRWARAHGHQISARGPIPASVRHAYDARGRRNGG
jgi:Lsr2